MTDLINVCLLPLQKFVIFIFSLPVGTSNLGSLLIVGVLFAILIEIVLHSAGSIPGLFKGGKNGKSGDSSGKH